MCAEIGELMCSQDRSGGSSLRRSSMFTTQANEWVLNNTDCCKKIHTLRVLHVYLLPALLISLYKLTVT